MATGINCGRPINGAVSSCAPPNGNIFGELRMSVKDGENWRLISIKDMANVIFADRKLPNWLRWRSGYSMARDTNCGRG